MRKDWQLKELQDMLFGQRSEKFIPDPEATQTAIQQTLGIEFDKTEVESIIEQTIASAATTSANSIKNSRRKSITRHIKGENLLQHIWRQKPLYMIL